MAPAIALVLLIAILLYVLGKTASLENEIVVLNPPPATHKIAANNATSSPTQTIIATSSNHMKTSATTTGTSPAQKIKPMPTKTRVEISPPQKITVHAEPLYSTSPFTLDEVNVHTRTALVNIFCTPKGGSIRPISGSGVIIDPKGVILTNAHVAQYILLSQSSKIDLSCLLRTGSPAVATWHPRLLYIPPVWVKEHANEINIENAMGTGEHDYALLLIQDSTDGSPLPKSFPYVPVDTRADVLLPDSHVLAAGYPAELVGGIIAQTGLYPLTSDATVQKLFTFASGTIDVISLGGILEAQGGSSGGAVVNLWNYLVGVITTTSAATSTSLRDLHAVSLPYIANDIYIQSGKTLSEILNGNLAEDASNFNASTSPELLNLYLKRLSQ